MRSGPRRHQRRLSRSTAPSGSPPERSDLGIRRDPAPRHGHRPIHVWRSRRRPRPIRRLRDMERAAPSPAIYGRSSCDGYRIQERLGPATISSSLTWVTRRRLHRDGISVAVTIRTGGKRHRRSAANARRRPVVHVAGGRSIQRCQRQRVRRYTGGFRADGTARGFLGVPNTVRPDVAAPSRASYSGYAKIVSLGPAMWLASSTESRERPSTATRFLGVYAKAHFDGDRRLPLRH